MLGLNAGTIIGAAAIAATAAWGGYSLRGDIQNSKLGQNFVERLRVEREVGIRREINLWTEIGDERRARKEMIETFQKIDEISIEARANLVAALASEKAKAAAALAEAQRNIEELRNASSGPAKDWKSQPIPADIVCGVFNGKGCPQPAYPATESHPDDDLEVRDGRPAAAEDGGAAPS